MSEDATNNLPVLSAEDEERLVQLVAECIDSGWMERKGGGWSRLLKFATPVPLDLEPHVIMLFYVVDAPAAMMVVATTHSQQMSKDRQLLRLRVQPIEQPQTASANHYSITTRSLPLKASAVMPTNGLFGSAAVAVA